MRIADFQGDVCMRGKARRATIMNPDWAESKGNGFREVRRPPAELTTTLDGSRGFGTGGRLLCFEVFAGLRQIILCNELYR